MSTPYLTRTIAHTASALDISRVTVWRLMKSGKLKTIKIGRRRLILMDSIEALLEADGVDRDKTKPHDTPATKNQSERAILRAVYNIGLFQPGETP